MVLFTEHPPVTAGWPADTAVFAANMFLIGVYGEGCFRACACDALLPALKKTRHPFFRTALISGLLFGYVHVVSADFSDLQQTLQFFLKMTNLALSGAAFMILYWKTRNLLGLAIVYGLNDFLPDVLNHIFQYQNMDTSAGYTSRYAGTTVIYLPAKRTPSIGADGYHRMGGDEFAPDRMTPKVFLPCIFSPIF